MVVDGTEVFAVGGVEFGGILHLSPANKLTHGTLLATVAMKLDVQELGTLQVQWHIIIDAIDGQLHVHPFHHVVVAIQHGNGRNFFRLLYGQEQIVLALLHLQQGMLVTQHGVLHLCCCSHEHRHCCHHCQ